LRALFQAARSASLVPGGDWQGRRRARWHVEPPGASPVDDNPARRRV